MSDLGSFDDWFSEAAVNADGDELLCRESASRGWNAAMQSKWNEVCQSGIQHYKEENDRLRAEVTSLKEERDAYKERGEARGQSVRDLTQQLAAANGMVEMLAGALRTSMVALDDWLNIFASEFCDKQRVKEAYARINAEGTIAYLAGIQESNRTALSNLNEDRAG
jgi:FtsZ-binding cell division protein ZapB